MGEVLLYVGRHQTLKEVESDAIARLGALLLAGCSEDSAHNGAIGLALEPLAW